MERDLEIDVDDEYDVDQEPELDQSQDNIVKEVIVFAIDAAPAMFERNIVYTRDGEQAATSSFALAVNSAVTLMKHKIMTGSKDEMAVLFYNTRETKNALNCNQLYQFVERGLPNANAIQALLDLSPAKFDKDVGSHHPAAADMRRASCLEALRDALWLTRHCLVGGKVTKLKLAYRLLLFSNREDPSEGRGITNNTFSGLNARVKALQGMRITARFFPFVACVKPFNMDLFWGPLMATLNENDPEKDGVDGMDEPGSTVGEGGDDEDQDELSTLDWRNGSASAYGPVCGVSGGTACSTQARGTADVWSRLSALLEHMKRSSSRRRVSMSLRFTLAPDVVIACEGFILVTEAKRPTTSVKLHAQNLLPVEVDTALIDETGIIIATPQATSKVFELPSRKSQAPDRFPKVAWSPEDWKQLIRVKPAGLVLLGTKPMACLKDHHNLSHSLFLRPCERLVEGSVPAFKALLDSLARLQRFALCRYVRTAGAHPQLVAVLPQQEETTEDGVQLQPEGLHLIPLPFKDDFRAPETDPGMVGTTWEGASAADVAAAEQLVAGMTVGYENGTIHNPALQFHFHVLQKRALAQPTDASQGPASLQQAEDKPPVDETLPDPAVAAAAIEHLSLFKSQLAERFGSQETQAGTPGAGSKRKAVLLGGADATIAEQYQMVCDWEGVIREEGADGLKKLTKDILTVYLKFHRLPFSGNKPDLIERIMRHRAAANG